MEYRIESVKVLSLGTTETEVELGCSAFLLENGSEEATVYFKEKDYDGVAVTADNGFALPPAAMMPVVLCGHCLSLLASADAADVRLLVLETL